MRSDADALSECVVKLLLRRGTTDAGVGAGVVVDLGGDHGALDDAFGASGLGRLVAGFHRDLSAPDALFDGVRDAVGDRQVAAVLLGDLPSRLAEPGEILDAARRFCLSAGGAPVVVHVPNVTHLDVGTKLLMGRWDDGGEILDPDLVRHFSDDGLTSYMATHGFAQLDAEDVHQPLSDQHFPSDAVPLEPTTAIGAQLAALRQMAGSAALVTHFIRLYEPLALTLPADSATPPVRPFLSVLLRTQGRRWETLQEALLCLAAQSCDDFEVLLLVHNGAERASATLATMVEEFHPSFARRVRVVEVHGGGRSRPLNVGALAARGRYLAMLDDDDLVFAHWVESFRSGAERHPGRMVRVPVATQQVADRPGTWAGRDGYEVAGRPRLLYPLEFDHVDHILDNRTPNNGYAVPRSFVVDLGHDWDESLPVLEDWDHLLRAASICGVVSIPVVTGLVRSWTVGEDSKSAHAEEVWEATRQRIIERNDGRPLVLDLGSFSQIRRLADRLDASSAELGAELGAAYHRIHLMYYSKSWRLTRPLRVASRGARSLRGALRRAPRVTPQVARTERGRR